MKATTNAKPVELGATNLERIERLSGAVSHLVARYRDTPNYPDCQPLKAAIWREYQETLAELMEAVHG
jgi:hypothetical protein